MDTDGRPAGTAVEVGASGVGGKRAGEIAVQLDNVLDPIGGDFCYVFRCTFLQDALADKRRHLGAYDEKNNVGLLAILLT